MEAWLNFLKDNLTNHALLQVFVGGCTMMLIGYMVTRAFRDREKLPPPALATISDMPPPDFRGPSAMIDLQREMRDYMRRISEDMGRIAECVRISREENVKQTALLTLIEREQAVENRSHERGDRDHR